MRETNNHGGARPGAGRPAGSRDRQAVVRERAIAAVIERIELGDLLQLGPGDVLRLAMLLALRRGDVDAAADYARRLVPVWQPGGAAAMLVNRLVRELHEPEAPPGVHQFWSLALSAAAAPAGRLASR